MSFSSNECLLHQKFAILIFDALGPGLVPSPLSPWLDCTTSYLLLCSLVSIQAIKSCRLRYPNHQLCLLLHHFIPFHIHSLIPSSFPSKKFTNPSYFLPFRHKFPRYPPKLLLETPNTSLATSLMQPIVLSHILLAQPPLPKANIDTRLPKRKKKQI